MVGLDTNVILRYLLQDDPKQALLHYAALRSRRQICYRACFYPLLESAVTALQQICHLDRSAA
jgi:hypothetical protein